MAPVILPNLSAYTHWATHVGRYSFDWHLVSEKPVEPAPT
jgi:hypothetical protein